MLLAALPADTLARLGPQLEPVQLVLRDVVHEPLEPVRHVYFPLHGVVSLVSAHRGAPSVELATVGSEGMVGVAAVLADGSIPHRACVQVPGAALRLPAAALVAEAKRDGALDGLIVQDPVQMGYLGVKTMVTHLKGGKVDRTIETGVHVVTHDNMDQPDMKALIEPDLSQCLK